MKLKTKNTSLTKYDISIAVVIIVTILLIIGVSAWFDQKKRQIDQEIENRGR